MVRMGRLFFVFVFVLLPRAGDMSWVFFFFFFFFLFSLPQGLRHVSGLFSSFYHFCFVLFYFTSQGPRGVLGPLFIFFIFYFFTSQGLRCFYFFYFTGPETRLVSSLCFMFFIILFTHRARDAFLGLFSSPDFVLFFFHPFTMPYVRRFNTKTMNQIANI